MGVVRKGIEPAIGLGLFLGLGTMMRPLWALYIALAAYHLIIGLLLIPVLHTLRQMSNRSGAALVH